MHQNIFPCGNSKDKRLWSTEQDTDQGIEDFYFLSSFAVNPVCTHTHVTLMSPDSPFPYGQ